MYTTTDVAKPNMAAFKRLERPVSPRRFLRYLSVFLAPLFTLFAILATVLGHQGAFSNPKTVDALPSLGPVWALAIQSMVFLYLSTRPAGKASSAIRSTDGATAGFNHKFQAHRSSTWVVATDVLIWLAFIVAMFWQIISFLGSDTSKLIINSFASVPVIIDL